MKNGSSASKRAMAELHSNGTDNNMDARGKNPEGRDKREELKKDLLGGGAFFDVTTDEGNKTEKTDSAPSKKDDVTASFMNVKQPQKKETPVGAASLSDGASIPQRGAVPRPDRMANSAGVIPGQGRAGMARPAQNGLGNSTRPETGNVNSAQGMGSSSKGTANTIHPEGRAAGASLAGVRPARGAAVKDIFPARPMQNSKVPAPSGAQGRDAKKNLQKATGASGAKKNVGKIIATVVSLALIIAVAVTLSVYFILNREDEFVPADVVAGNIVPETAGYSELMSDSSLSYLTQDRYSVKFTFYDKPEIVCTTKETTVGELMSKLGITVGEDNRCSADAESVLSSDSTVDIQTITYETVTKDEAIPYETEYIDVRTIPKGTTKISENGKNGVKTYTYKCTLVNGIEESRELIGETVTSKPKSKVMYRGVGGTITSQGITYKYSYYIDVKATVYNIVGTTASGLPTSVNVMAVDPRIIPLGTKCVVVGGGDYGYRIAADTGGNIKGNKIDLWYPAGTYSGFGWRNTRVYILE